MPVSQRSVIQCPGTDDQKKKEKKGTQATPMTAAVVVIITCGLADHIHNLHLNGKIHSSSL